MAVQDRQALSPFGSQAAKEKLPLDNDSKKDLEHHLPIDLLPDATAESFATWLQAHPSVEIISRDRGTTFADGATRGAPQALQIADLWHLLHHLGEVLEKFLTRHHADLKRVFTPPEEQDQLITALDQQALRRLKALSQAGQLR